MRANESRPETEGNGPPSRGGRLEMFYYERRGDRYYLRLTPLAVILIAGLTVISIAAVLVIFVLRGSRGASENVNVNVITPSASPFSANKPLIKQAPTPLSPPKVSQPQPVVIPTPSLIPTPAENANVPLGATPTPRHGASKPPT
jgi:hypothetical protein